MSKDFIKDIVGGFKSTVRDSESKDSMTIAMRLINGDKKSTMLSLIVDNEGHSDLVAEKEQARESLIGKACQIVNEILNHGKYCDYDQVTYDNFVKYVEQKFEDILDWNTPATMDYKTSIRLVIILTMEDYGLKVNVNMESLDEVSKVFKLHESCYFYIHARPLKENEILPTT